MSEPGTEPPDQAAPTGLDPVTLQVLVGGLHSICQEMGATLIRSAHSPNIKERQDCSTALFDAAGELVMQAEHIPVHLGSMPAAVGAILAEPQQQGDLWIVNDPFRGGTHLPDITLISPIFVGELLLGFTASRAHHADIGGPTPGGMPAFSTTLAEEGIVIPPTRVGDEQLRELAGRMRNTSQRLADLRAQRAANLLGERRLLELVERLGVELLQAGMAEVLDYSERRTRSALSAVPDGTYESSDVLESGASPAELRVAARVQGSSLQLDFSGSAAQVAGNLNCPLSVTRSAALFAVRVMLDPDAPPSAGGHRPVAVEAPLGSILNANPGAAVAAGNVETSGRVADLVLDALGETLPAPAQGQGTMNNLTLANADFTYYETIGGGQGACPQARGPDGVHVAMSNTLNTPIEALESELPIRVRALGLRRGSGGAGLYPGGAGVVRELEALEPMSFTLITERRRIAPRGRAGGGDGSTGRNLLNGEPLEAKAEGELQRGDRIRIETPGGGGFGRDPASE
jgi:N-methylhydantoinase B